MLRILRSKKNQPQQQQQLQQLYNDIIYIKVHTKYLLLKNT